MSDSRRPAAVGLRSDPGEPNRARSASPGNNLLRFGALLEQRKIIAIDALQMPLHLPHGSICVPGFEILHEALSRRQHIICNLLGTDRMNELPHDSDQRLHHDD